MDQEKVMDYTNGTKQEVHTLVSGKMVNKTVTVIIQKMEK